jgi:hypothetical protein
MILETLKAKEKKKKSFSSKKGVKLLMHVPFKKQRWYY